MRQTRRGCFTGRKTLKYVWYVYNSAGEMVDIVESDTMDYPIDGEQGGNHYVMMKGEYPMYVWDVFYIAQIIVGYEVKETAGGTVNMLDRIGSYYDWYGYYTYGTSYTFHSQTGQFDLTNAKQGITYAGGASGDPIVNFYQRCKNAYFAVGRDTYPSTTGLSYLYYNAQSYTEGAYGYVFEYEKSLVSSPIYTSGKGSATGQTAESYEQAAYPQDGVQGEYWYTYSHSYSYEFDNR